MLTLFGLGLSALLGQGYNGLKPVQTEAVPLGPLADIPFFGQVLFSSPDQTTPRQGPGFRG